MQPSWIRWLAALIAFNETNADRVMPFFGQEIFIQAQKKGPLTSPAYRAARAKCVRMSRTEGIDATLAKLGEQGIEPEKPPYTVREGGPRLCFVRDPDGYRIELIERGA